MKKNIFFLLTACLFCIGQAVADNRVTVSDVNVAQGGEATLEIGCEFDTEFTAFELQIALPDGLSLLADEDGYPIVERAFDTSHILTGNLLPSNGNYKITCRSMENLSMPISGSLLRVTLLADASLTVGTSLNATVTACEFTRTTDSQGESLADVPFAVNITEFRTILDENATTAPVAEANANVRVRRTINANEWSTICLPFAMTEVQVKEAFGSDVQICDFTGYDTIEDEEENIVGLTVSFEDAYAIEANHPYIIKVSAFVTEFIADGVTIEPEDNPSVSFGYSTGKKPVVYHPKDFVGTYVAEFDFYNDATSYPLFLNGNKFYYATENTMYMKAFRAYFDFDDVLTEVDDASASRIAMSFSDSSTGISQIESGRLNVEDAVYDLQGRRMAWRAGTRPAPTGLRKGIYVKEGKKVIIK